MRRSSYQVTFRAAGNWPSRKPKENESFPSSGHLEARPSAFLIRDKVTRRAATMHRSGPYGMTAACTIQGRLITDGCDVRESWEGGARDSQLSRRSPRHTWHTPLVAYRGSVSNECRPMTVIDNNKKNGGGAKLTSSLTDCFVKRAVRKCLAVMRQKLTINRKVLDNCSFCVELWRIERMWASGRKVVGNGKVTT